MASISKKVYKQTFKPVAVYLYEIHRYMICDMFNVCGVSMAERSKWKFIFCASFFAAGICFGTFCLQGDVHSPLEMAFTRTLYRRSPYPFIHQMYPKEIWHTMDICAGAIAGVSFTCFYATMVVHPLLGEKHRINLRKPRKTSIRCLPRIKLMHERTIAWTFKFLFVIVVSIELYSYYMVFWYSQAFRLNWQQTVYWFAMHPLILFYYMFGRDTTIVECLILG